MSTWIYENRASKHFVISRNFPCLSLFPVLLAYVSSFLCCFVIRDFSRSCCRQDFANFCRTLTLTHCRENVRLWFPHSVDRQDSGMLSRGWAVAQKYSAPGIKTLRQCLDKTNPWLGKTGSRFSFSGHLALNRRHVFADQKVIIWIQSFIG